MARLLAIQTSVETALLLGISSIPDQCWCETAFRGKSHRTLGSGLSAAVLEVAVDPVISEVRDHSSDHNSNSLCSY